MATLQKIRSRAVLLTLIIGFALFAFIIGDFLNSGSSIFRQSQQKIAKIGNTSLDYKEYEARIDEMQEVYKIQTGQSSLDDDILGQIRESVFQTIVHERLLDEQAEKLGVTVTGKELFDMINGSNVHPMIQQLPIFQNPQTGGFDRSIMMKFLQTIQTDDLSKYDQSTQEQIKQLKKYWMFWENNLKYTRLEEKINVLLSKAVQANSLDAEVQFGERSENVDFAYVCQPYTSLPDSLFKVSSRDIKKRYSAEKERFVQIPYRSAKYILVDVKASKDDFDEIQKKILDLKSDFATATDPIPFANSNSDVDVPNCYVANSMFNPTVRKFIESNQAGAMLQPVYSDNVYQMARLIGKTVASDSVKARQIVLPTGSDKTADSIVSAVRGGADFMALAAKYSRGGNAEMGWFREMDALQQMGPEFVSACFNAAAKSTFTVKTKYGISVVQVTDKTKPVAKAKVALISMNLTPSSQTYSVLYNRLNQIVAQNQSSNDFFKAARKAGYQVQTAQYVRQSDMSLANIPQMRQAVRFIFNGKLGDISGILENSNNQFVVAGITKISDGDYMSVEDASPILAAEMRNEKKADKIAATMLSKKASSLVALSSSTGLKIDSARFVNFSMNNITSIGQEPALIAAVTTAAKGRLSQPVKGKIGVYVFNVGAKTRTQERFNVQAEKAAWNSNNMYRVIYQSFDAVKKVSKVVDKRIRFY